MMLAWRLLSLVMMVIGSVSSLSDSCPVVCACKWKGGKQTVECMDRALITIPAKVNPETQVLDMSGNNLQILPRDTFIHAGLLNLQRVFLRSCRIGQIDDRAFNGLTNLIELDLSQNLLTSVPSKTFQDVPFLRDVILSYNPIQKIETFAFRTLPGLVKLDMSHCELQMIAPKAFEGVEGLESLKLNGNRLTELRPRTVETLSKLHGIELHDNPWYCDCRLRAAKLWLTDNNIAYPVAPVCIGGPEKVVDRTFAELDVDDFACKPEILPVNRYVEATTGDNATIICRVGAVPQATIHWYWAGRLLQNNTAFSSHQRIYIYEDGLFEKSSSLVLTNAQESDSSEYYCVADNRAGSAEANFTLHVSMRTAGMATLGSGQIAGLSAALVILILFILLIILFLLIRLRRLPFSESKTPGQVESVITVNGTTMAHSNKPSSTAPGPNIDTSFTERKVVPSDLKLTNPVQKPPRVTEIPNTNYEGSNGSIVNTTQSHISPTSGVPNNPDLIKDTRRLTAEDVSSSVPNGHVVSETEDKQLRPGSGEYSRADSLYPSGLWDQPPPSPDLFVTRTNSSSATGFNYDDKTPIIGGSEDEEYRTFSQSLEGYPPDYGLPILPVDQKLREVGANLATSPTTIPSAKTLRVWQKGVPVLPPVTALKRVLSRNSPDEGYQEGCGTDV